MVDLWAEHCEHELGARYDDERERYASSQLDLEEEAYCSFAAENPEVGFEAWRALCAAAVAAHRRDAHREFLEREAARGNIDTDDPDCIPF